MNLDDIRLAALNHRRDTYRNPKFVLLTAAEYDGIRASAKFAQAFTHTGTADPEIYGMTVVIHGSRFHDKLEKAGVEMLRPNNL